MEYAFAFLLGLGVAILAAYGIHRWLSFAAQNPDDYAETGPELDIREHLDGPLLCEGVIYGPTGRVASRFVAEMNASWDGNTGVMTEEFRYDNGSTQLREWTLHLDHTGRITATAPDIIGKGHGRQTGAGVRLAYAIKLPDASGGHILNAIDWMYLVENGTIINRSQFRKFGIRVAELVATIRPMKAVAAGRPALAAE